MRITVEKWGDDLAVRIPQEIADAMGISDGSQVELKIRSGSIFVTPKSRVLPSLTEMVSRITKENIHPETDWGPPIGKEIW